MSWNVQFIDENIAKKAHEMEMKLKEEVQNYLKDNHKDLLDKKYNMEISLRQLQQDTKELDTLLVIAKSPQLNAKLGNLLEFIHEELNNTNADYVELLDELERLKKKAYGKIKDVREKELQEVENERTQKEIEMLQRQIEEKQNKIQ